MTTTFIIIIPWPLHTKTIIRFSCQSVLQRLKQFGLNPKILTSFYRCTIWSILTGCISVWYGTYPTHNHKALQRVLRTAELITGNNSHPEKSIYWSRCLRKAHKIISDLQPINITKSLETLFTCFFSIPPLPLRPFTLDMLHLFTLHLTLYSWSLYT